VPAREDVIVWLKKGGPQGSIYQFERLYGLSWLNVLAHLPEGDPDWKNWRDMFDDRSRQII
jgi:hypothetical protein